MHVVNFYIPPAVVVVDVVVVVVGAVKLRIVGVTTAATKAPVIKRTRRA